MQVLCSAPAFAAGERSVWQCGVVCAGVLCGVVCANVLRGPRVESRGLKIGGGNLIHRKVVFSIFRCQSIWVGISGDNLSSRIFWRNYKFQNKVT